MPGVSFYLPFSSWILKEGMSCGAGYRRAKSVTNSSPQDFFLFRLLSCSLHQFLVADNIWLVNLEVSFEAGIGKYISWMNRITFLLWKSFSQQIH